MVSLLVLLETADFSDCLIAARNTRPGCHASATFARRSLKLGRLLEKAWRGVELTDTDHRYAVV
jgi:hypothetical protein